MLQTLLNPHMTCPIFVLCATSLIACDSASVSQTPNPIITATTVNNSIPASTLDHNTKPTTPTSPVSPPGLQNLSVTINEAPLGLASALAYTEGSSATKVVFSTANLTCQDLGGKPAKDEERFIVTVSPMLRSDGSRPMRISHLDFGRFSKASNSNNGDGLGLFEGTTDPTQVVEGTLEFTSDYPSKGTDTKERRLMVKGTFAAKGCGVMLTKIAGRKPAPKPKPQNSLKLTLAGVTFDVVGATLSAGTFRMSYDGDPIEGYQLSLSTAPMDCESFQRDRDLFLQLEFVEGKHVFSIYIWGSVLFGPVDVNLFDAENPLTITPVPKRKRLGSRDRVPAHGETLRLAVDGEREVDLGYVLALEGEVQALRCAPLEP